MKRTVTQPTLWLKLSDDTSLPETLDTAARERLRRIFDPADPASPWSQALRTLGLSWPGGPVLRWQGETAYVNGSALTAMISAGWVTVTRNPDGSYGYVSRSRLGKLPALIKSQWKIESFLTQALAQDSPIPRMSDEEQILESLRLGLTMQAMMLRLPKHDSRELACWLAGTMAPPPRIKKLVETLQEIQVRRTRLSAAWERLFSSRGSVPQAQAPSWFWEGQPAEPPSTPKAVAEKAGTGPWMGLPVHSGRCSGRAWLVDPRNPGPPPPGPYVAVFAQARPGTVEHFKGAAALVFGEGGVLSHACTVAREQGIPTVTAAGRSLIEALRVRPETWLTVDGSTGEIQLSESTSRSAPGGSKSSDPTS